MRRWENNELEALALIADLHPVEFRLVAGVFAEEADNGRRAVVMSGCDCRDELSGRAQVLQEVADIFADPCAAWTIRKATDEPATPPEKPPTSLMPS
jgi:hypothetical protein